MNEQTPARSAPFKGVIFTVSDLAVSRGGRRIVAGVSLEAAPGDAIVLRGPNGAGKTTLLRAFAGLLRPDEGEVSIAPAAGGEGAGGASETSVFCGALNAHKAALTVRENLAFWAALYGAPTLDNKAGRIEAASAQFGLDPYSDYLAGALSTGLARRLGLARLVIAQRPLWFIDEPTASLDSASIETFLSLVEAHRQRGGLAVIATHDPLPLKGARIFTLAAEARAA